MDNSPMLSTPIPETTLRDGHASASDTTAFSTCKSLHINFLLCATKVSFRYLLVEDKQGSSVVIKRRKPLHH
jgi:hypothetical protein